MSNTTIFKALNCLIGSNCIVSTPDTFYTGPKGYISQSELLDELEKMSKRIDTIEEAIESSTIGNQGNTYIKLVQDETNINDLENGSYFILDVLDDTVMSTLRKLNSNLAVVSGAITIESNGLIYQNQTVASNRTYINVDGKWSLK